MKGKKFVRDRKEEERIKQFCRENGLEDIAEQIQAVYVEVGVAEERLVLMQMPEIVEVIVKANFETKGLPEETVRRAIKRVFRNEIPYNSDKWRFYNGGEIYADVEIKIGNSGASMDFRVKAWQVEAFVEVLKKRVEELKKLIDELAKHRELNEILNDTEEIKIKPRTFAEVFTENRIDVIC